MISRMKYSRRVIVLVPVLIVAAVIIALINLSMSPTGPLGGDLHWTTLQELHDTDVSVRNGTVYLQQVSFPTGVQISTLEFATNVNGLPTEYAKDANHVYYIPADWDDSGHLYIQTIETLSADPTTFRPIWGVPLADLPSDISTFIGPDHNWQCLYDSYGADDHNVYFQDYTISGADPASFSIIFHDYGCPTNYDRDSRHIYFDANGDQTTSILPSWVDVASFRVIDDSEYTEDEDHVYEPGGVPISNDPGSFVLVSPSQSCGKDCFFDAEDSNYYYLEGNGALPR
jgi:hypothetical protein